MGGAGVEARAGWGGSEAEGWAGEGGSGWEADKWGWMGPVQAVRDAVRLVKGTKVVAGCLRGVGGEGTVLAKCDGVGGRGTQGSAVLVSRGEERQGQPWRLSRTACKRGLIVL